MSHRRHINSGPCYLYGLVDPRNGQVFYVGVTWNPKSRLNDHRNDPSSSAFHRCREIIEAGFEVLIEVPEVFPDRRSAERVERILIKEISGLTNAQAYIT